MSKASEDLRGFMIDANRAMSRASGEVVRGNLTSTFIALGEVKDLAGRCRQLITKIQQEAGDE